MPGKSPSTMKSTSSIGFTLALACLTQVVFGVTAAGARTRPPTRLPTAPGTPALIAAGPDAAALARAAAGKAPSTNAAADNPTVAAPGANPPANVDGNFLIGPVYVRAPALKVIPGVPRGRVEQFIMKSADSKLYPGIARDYRKIDPQNARTLIVKTHPAPYTRAVTVYIPSQYVAGTAAPFIVVQDGPRAGRRDMSLPHILDNLIARHRLPVMIAILIANGGGDGQGSERGLEYDTVSGKYGEFVETEVLPRVEKICGVKLTKDPDGRAVMGGSSGGAAAFAMAWFHPEWFRRVISYSGTFVNQQWPFNPATPDGAWDFHEKLIPNSARKPIRVWLEVGDRDLLNPGIIRDHMHDWVIANNRMATVLKAKGYHYQYVFALNAGHVDRAVKNQTLPEALEWVWRGYRNMVTSRPSDEL